MGRPGSLDQDAYAMMNRHWEALQTKLVHETAEKEGLQKVVEQLIRQNQDLSLRVQGMEVCLKQEADRKASSPGSSGFQDPSQEAADHQRQAAPTQEAAQDPQREVRSSQEAADPQREVRSSQEAADFQREVLDPPRFDHGLSPPVPEDAHGPRPQAAGSQEAASDPQQEAACESSTSRTPKFSIWRQHD